MMVSCSYGSQWPSSTWCLLVTRMARVGEVPTVAKAVGVVLVAIGVVAIWLPWLLAGLMPPDVRDADDVRQANG